ncbi:MAG: CDP-diacylglycerol--serine O-phosphatidyltransferase [Gemmatimonadetes bacterium]|nr:CDP-diacylglycerol--serine O-phosphatidyltransferase [Gemmatimonadota bacterium]
MEQDAAGARAARRGRRRRHRALSGDLQAAHGQRAGRLARARARSGRRPFVGRGGRTAVSPPLDPPAGGRSPLERRRLIPRGSLQRGIIILPSAFTLGNLFFGVFAIVSATRGEFGRAAWYIVTAGILDMLDGRIARFTRTGSAFGAELDSLVDAVSFGVAPALIMYQLYFIEGVWSWTLCFVFIMAVVVRLARFNVEQAGRAKSHFIGLPSPTAGMILATYYPFSQTAFFQSRLDHLPWPQIMGMVMVLLGVVMLSHIPYPVVPRIGYKSVRAVLTTAFMAACVVVGLIMPQEFFFPFLLTYTLVGLIRSVGLGLLDRLPDRDPLLDEDDEDADEADAELRTLDYGEVAPTRVRREINHPSPEEGR